MAKVRISKGKFNGISACADDNGVIAAAAMDQRGFTAAIANFHQEGRYLSSSEFRAFALGQIEKQRRLVEELGLRLN